MKNSKGFTVIEGLLILIIVGIIGGTGWYVYNVRQNTDNNLNSANQVNNSTPKYKKKATDPTASWKSYSTIKGVFSLKYPGVWSTAVCDDGEILLGPTAATTGHCNSDAPTEMFVLSQSGDQRSNYNLMIQNYPDLKKEDVTINNVKGEKQSGTLSIAQGTYTGPGPADKTKTVYYVFFVNTRTYIAEYLQDPAYPDSLSDFNLMVTKTLKFSS